MKVTKFPDWAACDGLFFVLLQPSESKQNQIILLGSTSPSLADTCWFGAAEDFLVDR